MKKAKRFFGIMMAIIVFTTLSPTFSSHVSAAESPYLNRMNELTGDNFPYSNPMTREDFCVVIAKLFVGQTTQNTEQTLPFADAASVKTDSIPYLAELSARGILLGSAEGGKVYMHPGAVITRQEAFTFLGRVLGGTSDSAVRFTDVQEIAEYAYKYIAWFADYRIAVGYPDGYLRPQAGMSAGELASLTMKAVDFKALNDAQLKTLMGTGSRGHLDGDIKTARFTFPGGVLLDKSGEVIVFDTYNNAIRKIGDSEATTIAGKVIALDENRLPKGAHLDGDPKGALFSRPAGGVVNATNELFIADSGNNVIRFIRGGKVYTFCGTKAGYKDGADDVAQFNNPAAIAIDQNNNIYVADTLNNCIRKVDTKGNVTTIAGTPMTEGDADGAAGQAKFRTPEGIAVEKDGSIIYVADTGNHKIKKIQNGTVTTIAGSAPDKDEDGDPVGGYADGEAAAAQFTLPMGIALADGVLLIADSGNNVIRAISKSGMVLTIAGNGEPGDAEGGARMAGLNQPAGVEYANKMLYIADTLNNKIKMMPFNPGTLE